MQGEPFMEKPPWNTPCEVFLPHHVAGNWRVPGRGDLGRWVHWLRFHCPHVVVADVVVYHGGEGWREGQTSRGKERMITTQHKRNNWPKSGYSEYLLFVLFDLLYCISHANKTICFQHNDNSTEHH